MKEKCRFQLLRALPSCFRPPEWQLAFAKAKDQSGIPGFLKSSKRYFHFQKKLDQTYQRKFS